MKVTLKKIAKKAGYSISTVSRVLNGSDKISLEVQKHILKIADELNYPFDKTKISLFKNGTKDITLITDFGEGEFYASFFYGYFNAANDMNINLSLVSVTNQLDRIYDIVVNQKKHNIDGVALFIPSMEKQDYNSLLKKLHSEPDGIPIVSNGLIQSPVMPTVTFDGYSAGHIAAEYFHKKSYSPLGVIKGPEGKAESSFRLNGFKDYCLHQDVEISWEFTGDFNYQSGFNAFENFEKSIKKPRAIFISNDLMAFGFMEAARLKGTVVPNDVAIISYDDLPMCVQVHPRLSSIKTDFYELGKLTLQSLLNIIANKKDNSSTLSLIPVNLVDRESS